MPAFLGYLYETRPFYPLCWGLNGPRGVTRYGVYLWGRRAPKVHRTWRPAPRSKMMAAKKKEPRGPRSWLRDCVGFGGGVCHRSPSGRILAGGRLRARPCGPRRMAGVRFRARPYGPRRMAGVRFRARPCGPRRMAGVRFRAWPYGPRRLVGDRLRARPCGPGTRLASCYGIPTSGPRRLVGVVSEPLRVSELNRSHAPPEPLRSGIVSGTDPSFSLASRGCNPCPRLSFQCWQGSDPRNKPRSIDGEDSNRGD